MKKFLSLVLALVMTMSLVTVSAGAEDFTDAEDITYVEAVEVMKAVGVVDGDTAGNFNPANGLTRGAAAKIICNLILGPTTAAALNADTNPYPDVDKDSTFAGYIAYCQKEGIISGYADGTFKPANPLTGYAFMKMLLGALGYDVEVEGYTGANWSINVAKRALNIGLDSGLVDAFNGSDYVTREEAMLYAFNAMQADMVQYDTTITIGDVTVAGSKAEVVANNAKVEGIDNDNVMQFAEKYFSNLKGVADTDAFERPATTWTIKSKAVGTYSETPDLSYTAGTKLGTIYADLGLTKGIDSTAVTYYVDGVKTPWTADIVKGDTAKTGGNGVLTEVFYDADTHTAIIVAVNTYIGEVAAVRTASTTKDTYVVLYTGDAYTKPGTIDNEFETDLFEKEDVVAYTYSYKAGEDCIQSMATVEKVTGAMSTYTTEGSVTVGGTKYSANAKSAANIASFAPTVDRGAEIAVYLDENGYALMIDADTGDDLAVLLAYEQKFAGSLSYDRAKLLFTDGTVKTVNVEDQTIAAGWNKMSVNDIVSYTIDADGVYDLTLVADSQGTTASGATKIVINGAPTVALGSLYADLAGTYASGVTSANVDGETIFLVKDVTGSKTTYAAYEGIANVPTMTLASGKTVTTAAYAEDAIDNATLTVVYIERTSDVTVSSDSKDVLYIKGVSTHTASAPYTGRSYTTELGYFYQYDAFLNGEETVVKTDVPVNVDQLIYGPIYNTKGVIIAAEQEVAVDGTSAGADFDTDMVYTVGTDALVNSVIKFGGVAYAYEKDVNVYFVDIEGNLTEGDLSAIAEDLDDKVFLKTDATSGKLTDVYVKVVDAISSVTPEIGGKLTAVTLVEDGSGNLDVTVSNTAFGAVTVVTVKVQEYMKATNTWVDVASTTSTWTATATGKGFDDFVANGAAVPGNIYRAVVSYTGGSVTSTNTIASI